MSQADNKFEPSSPAPPPPPYTDQFHNQQVNMNNNYRQFQEPGNTILVMGQPQPQSTSTVVNIGDKGRSCYCCCCACPFWLCGLILGFIIVAAIISTIANA